MRGRATPLVSVRAWRRGAWRRYEIGSAKSAAQVRYPGGWPPGKTS